MTTSHSFSIAAGTLLVAALSGCATPNAAVPQSLKAVTITSGAAALDARIYMPGGAGPHRTVVLMHGMPGGEKLDVASPADPAGDIAPATGAGVHLDLAQAIRRAGWNVVTFHYRGNWSSGGDFSPANVVEDVGAALAYVRGAATDRSLRIDARNIVVVGHSVGGFAALAAGAADPGVKSIAAVSAFDLGLVSERARSDPALRATQVKFVTGNKALKVPNPEGMIDQAIASSAELKLAGKTERLSKKSLLLVVATMDTAAPMPMHHTPLLAGLQAAKAGNITEVVMETDHGYSNQRGALVASVLAWLQKQD